VNQLQPTSTNSEFQGDIDTDLDEESFSSMMDEDAEQGKKSERKEPTLNPRSQFHNLRSKKN